MRHVFVTFLVCLGATACGSSSPVSPSTATTVSGTWTGSSHDTSGQETISWTVSQAGNTLSGTVGMSDTTRSMMGSGTMTGTVSGNTVTFRMTVPTGGFNGFMSSCSMMVDGQATMSSDGHTMTGSYSGNMSGMMSGSMMNQSCGGAMQNGQFTLTR
jgi:hypothetical protein